MASSKHPIVAVMLCLALATSVWSSEAVTQQIQLHENFTLDYEVSDNTTIVFVLEAKTGGWIGIGINYKTPTMLNSDYFVGYVNESNKAFGTDCHIVPGETHPHAAGGEILHNSPTPDPTGLQNWEVISGFETTDTATKVTTTRLEISRSLNTTDAKYDHVITNSTFYLIWAFNADTDDVNTMHSVKGFEKINLLTGNLGGTPGDGDGGDKSDIGEEDGHGGDGAAMISIGMSTLFITLTASVMKAF